MCAIKLSGGGAKSWTVSTISLAR